MTVNADFRQIKEKEIDNKKVLLKISKHLLTGRIFVEFSCKNPNILLQKNFQDSVQGRKESEEFSKSIKNAEQLKRYFGLNKKTQEEGK